MSKTKPQSHDFHLAQAVECGRIAWAAYEQGDAKKCRDYAANYREHAAKGVKVLQRTMYPMIAQMVFRADLLREHKDAP